MQLSDFDYHLPSEAIAQEPISPRDHSRLLVSNRHMQLTDHHFYNLPDLLEAGDLLVLNNSKVVKSRLQCTKGNASIELFLNKPEQDGRWHAFAKPARKVNPDDVFNFGKHSIRVVSKGEMGRLVLAFDLHDSINLFEFLEEHGITPLPPYIKRSETDQQLLDDAQRYQTVYSDKQGSVAAPTAGLHFTDELLEKLLAKGVQIKYVTLHVGAGTFLPVKTENLAEHQMHSEFCEISPDTADTVNHALELKRRIITVGTTSLRTLESAAIRNDTIIAEAFETELFITPGFEFKVANGLITNFHLPKSTPLMLTSAFGGHEHVLKAYQHALQHHYRFCSYGDACLFFREESL